MSSRPVSVQIIIDLKDPEIASFTKAEIMHYLTFASGASVSAKDKKRFEEKIKGMREILKSIELAKTALKSETVMNKINEPKLTEYLNALNDYRNRYGLSSPYGRKHRSKALRIEENVQAKIDEINKRKSDIVAELEIKKLRDSEIDLVNKLSNKTTFMKSLKEKFEFIRGVRMAHTDILECLQVIAILINDDNELLHDELIKRISITHTDPELQIFLLLRDLYKGRIEQNAHSYILKEWKGAKIEQKQLENFRGIVNDFLKEYQELYNKEVEKFYRDKKIKYRIDFPKSNEVLKGKVESTDRIRRHNTFMDTLSLYGTPFTIAEAEEERKLLGRALQALLIEAKRVELKVDGAMQIRIDTGALNDIVEEAKNDQEKIEALRENIDLFARKLGSVAGMGRTLSPILSELAKVNAPNINIKEALKITRSAVINLTSQVKIAAENKDKLDASEAERAKLGQAINDLLSETKDAEEGTDEAEIKKAADALQTKVNEAKVSQERMDLLKGPEGAINAFSKSLDSVSAGDLKEEVKVAVEALRKISTEDTKVALLNTKNTIEKLTKQIKEAKRKAAEKEVLDEAREKLSNAVSQLSILATNGGPALEIKELQNRADALVHSNAKGNYIQSFKDAVPTLLHNAPTTTVVAALGTAVGSIDPDVLNLATSQILKLIDAIKEKMDFVMFSGIVNQLSKEDQEKARNFIGGFSSEQIVNLVKNADKTNYENFISKVRSEVLTRLIEKMGGDKPRVIGIKERKEDVGKPEGVLLSQFIIFFSKTREECFQHIKDLQNIESKEIRANLEYACERLYWIHGARDEESREKEINAMSADELDTFITRFSDDKSGAIPRFVTYAKEKYAPYERARKELAQAVLDLSNVPLKYSSVLPGAIDITKTEELSGAEDIKKVAVTLYNAVAANAQIVPHAHLVAMDGDLKTFADALIKPGGVTGDLKGDVQKAKDGLTSQVINKTVTPELLITATGQIRNVIEAINAAKRRAEEKEKKRLADEKAALAEAERRRQEEERKELEISKSKFLEAVQRLVKESKGDAAVLGANVNEIKDTKEASIIDFKRSLEALSNYEVEMDLGKAKGALPDKGDLDKKATLEAATAAINTLTDSVQRAKNEMKEARSKLLKAAQDLSVIPKPTGEVLNQDAQKGAVTIITAADTFFKNIEKQTAQDLKKMAIQKFITDLAGIPADVPLKSEKNVTDAITELKGVAEKATTKAGLDAATAAVIKLNGAVKLAITNAEEAQRAKEEKEQKEREEAERKRREEEERRRREEELEEERKAGIKAAYERMVKAAGALSAVTDVNELTGAPGIVALAKKLHTAMALGTRTEEKAAEDITQESKELDALLGLLDPAKVDKLYQDGAKAAASKLDEVVGKPVNMKNLIKAAEGLEELTNAINDAKPKAKARKAKARERWELGAARAKIVARLKLGGKKEEAERKKREKERVAEEKRIAEQTERKALGEAVKALIEVSESDDYKEIKDKGEFKGGLDIISAAKDLDSAISNTGILEKTLRSNYINKFGTVVSGAALSTFEEKYKREFNESKARFDMAVSDKVSVQKGLKDSTAEVVQLKTTIIDLIAHIKEKAEKEKKERQDKAKEKLLEAVTKLADLAKKGDYDQIKGREEFKGGETIVNAAQALMTAVKTEDADTLKSGTGAIFAFAGAVGGVENAADTDADKTLKSSISGQAKLYGAAIANPDTETALEETTKAVNTLRNAVEGALKRAREAKVDADRKKREEDERKALELRVSTAAFIEAVQGLAKEAKGDITVLGADVKEIKDATESSIILLKSSLSSVSSIFEVTDNVITILPASGGLENNKSGLDQATLAINALRSSVKTAKNDMKAARGKLLSEAKKLSKIPMPVGEALNQEAQKGADIIITTADTFFKNIEDQTAQDLKKMAIKDFITALAGIPDGVPLKTEPKVTEAIAELKRAADNTNTKVGLEEARTAVIKLKDAVKIAIENAVNAQNAKEEEERKAREEADRLRREEERKTEEELVKSRLALVKAIEELATEAKEAPEFGTNPLELKGNDEKALRDFHTAVGIKRIYAVPTKTEMEIFDKAIPDTANLIDINGAATAINELTDRVKKAREAAEKRAKDDLINAIKGLVRAAEGAPEYPDPKPLQLTGEDLSAFHDSINGRVIYGVTTVRATGLLKEALDKGSIKTFIDATSAIHRLTAEVTAVKNARIELANAISILEESAKGSLELISGGLKAGFESAVASIVNNRGKPEPIRRLNSVLIPISTLSGIDITTEKDRLAEAGNDNATPREIEAATDAVNKLSRAIVQKIEEDKVAALKAKMAAGKKASEGIDAARLALSSAIQGLVLVSKGDPTFDYKALEKTATTVRIRRGDADSISKFILPAAIFNIKTKTENASLLEAGKSDAKKEVIEETTRKIIELTDKIKKAKLAKEEAERKASEDEERKNREEEKELEEARKRLWTAVHRLVVIVTKDAEKAKGVAEIVNFANVLQSLISGAADNKDLTEALKANSKGGALFDFADSLAGIAAKSDFKVPAEKLVIDLGIAIKIPNARDALLEAANKISAFSVLVATAADAARAKKQEEEEEKKAKELAESKARDALGKAVRELVKIGEAVDYSEIKGRKDFKGAADIIAAAKLLETEIGKPKITSKALKDPLGAIPSFAIAVGNGAQEGGTEAKFKGEIKDIKGNIDTAVTHNTDQALTETTAQVTILTGKINELVQRTKALKIAEEAVAKVRKAAIDLAKSLLAVEKQISTMTGQEVLKHLSALTEERMTLDRLMIEARSKMLNYKGDISKLNLPMGYANKVLKDTGIIINKLNARVIEIRKKAQKLVGLAEDHRNVLKSYLGGLDAGTIQKMPLNVVEATIIDLNAKKAILDNAIKEAESGLSIMDSSDKLYNPLRERLDKTKLEIDEALKLLISQQSNLNKPTVSVMTGPPTSPSPTPPPMAPPTTSASKKHAERVEYSELAMWRAKRSGEKHGKVESSLRQKLENPTSDDGWKALVTKMQTKFETEKTEAAVVKQKDIEPGAALQYQQILEKRKHMEKHLRKGPERKEEKIHEALKNMGELYATRKIAPVHETSVPGEINKTNSYHLVNNGTPEATVTRHKNDSDPSQNKVSITAVEAAPGDETIVMMLEQAREVMLQAKIELGSRPINIENCEDRDTALKVATYATKMNLTFKFDKSVFDLFDDEDKKYVAELEKEVQANIKSRAGSKPPSSTV